MILRGIRVNAEFTFPKTQLENVQSYVFLVFKKLINRSLLISLPSKCTHSQITHITILVMYMLISLAYLYMQQKGLLAENMQNMQTIF